MIIRIGLPTIKLRFRQLIMRSGLQAILYCEEAHDQNPAENKAVSSTFSVLGEEARWGRALKGVGGRQTVAHEGPRGWL